jgi:hypothetical protein
MIITVDETKLSALNKTRKIALINATYLPQLSQLDQAERRASLRGQKTDTIKAQYAQAFDEYIAKKGEIMKNG